MKISRRSFNKLAIVGAGICASPSFAQVSALPPDRPVKMVVPVTAGGIVDLMGRAVAEFMAKDLQKSFIVENRPGAAMAIGAVAVARAAPDGATLIMMSSSPLILNPLIYKNLQYDPQNDFRLLSVVADSPYVLLVKKSSPVTSVAELVSLAKTGKRMTYGSAGIGSIVHVTTEMLKYKAKIDMTHVPFTGSGPALVALLGDQIDVYFGEISTFLPHIKSGDLRALAVTSANRLDVIPDVPTMIERGYDNFISGTWFVVGAPAKVPANVADVLKASADRANSDPDFLSLLQRSGLTPQKPRSYEEIDQMRKDGLERWRPIITAQNISIE